LGADRRGPLAAFIIVAVIAAILLVTSVRSQAAPWLIPGRISATVAAPALEPHLWGSVSGGVDDVVQAGAVLVRKASTDAQEPTRTTQPPASPHVVAGRLGRATVPPRQHRSTRTRHQPARQHGPSGPSDPGDDDPVDAPADPVGQAPTDPDPGDKPGHARHLGWYKHHAADSDDPVISEDDPADAGDPPGSTDADPGHASGHGHGHGKGH
jgi:hypothetical protein